MSKNYNKSNERIYGYEADVTVVDEVSKEDDLVEVEVPTFEGVVSGCNRLNIRNQADIDSEILLIIEKDSPVIIYPADSNDEWLSVYTESGVKGFCMKKFITIKES